MVKVLHDPSGVVISCLGVEEGTEMAKCRTAGIEKSCSVSQRRPFRSSCFVYGIVLQCKSLGFLMRHI